MLPKQPEHFLSEFNNRETMADIEANNDTNRIENSRRVTKEILQLGI